jgi:probable HAF family extracellular repeat protein
MTAGEMPSARAGSYVFTNFDGPPDSSAGTTVDGINNLGQAVGFGVGATDTITNFIRNTDGSFTTLSFAGSGMAIANGINTSDQVVGMSGASAFFLTNGGNTVITLPAVTGTTTAEAAFGLNDHGTIVGQYSDSNSGTSPGFVYSAGAFTTLDPLGFSAQVFAQGINNNGLVVGFYNTDGEHDHGFLFNSKTSSYTLLADPNVANFFFTQFLGINDHGEAVGYYQTNDGSQHGFLYDLAKQTYTFLDDPNIATSGVQITQITGINNAGEIAGFYVDGINGLQRGFVAASAVPEPGSLALMGIGATFVCGLAARKARRSRGNA